MRWRLLCFCFPEGSPARGLAFIGDTTREEAPIRRRQRREWMPDAFDLDPLLPLAFSRHPPIPRKQMKEPRPGWVNKMIAAELSDKHDRGGVVCASPGPVRTHAALDANV